MWKRKDLKKAAKHSLRLNYVACIAVCFIMMFVAGAYDDTLRVILEYDTHNVANLRYDFDQKAQIVDEIQELCGGDLKKAEEEIINKAVDEISKKYEISDKRSVRMWVDLYIKKGVGALNFREVSLAGATGEISNWETIIQTFEMMNTGDVEISNDENLIEKPIAYVFDTITNEDKSKIGVINNIIRLFNTNDVLRVIISLISSLLSFAVSVFIGVPLFAVSVFIGVPLTIGERRFFIENRTYHKTRIGRIGFLFRERCFKPIVTMLLRILYAFFWLFTIIGGPIKTYEYEMIPYILAENPKIDRKKAFKLSKQMMKGNKWRSFVIDISFFPWIILISTSAALISALFIGFSLTNILVSNICYALLMALFINPYKSATKTELYIVLRKKAIREGFTYSEELKDKYIDLDLLEEMMSNSSLEKSDE